jgi:predicted metal-dependent peptidase
MMTKSAKNASEELSRSILAMLLKEPFFAHLLGGIPRRICDDVPTAAVALTPRGTELIVNPVFFVDELGVQERVAVIKHEALHLVFRHLYRPLIKNGDAEIFNIAADLVVNQHVHPWPLPESAVTLKLFPDLNLEPNKTVEWYYEKLISLHRELGTKNPEQTSAPSSAESLNRIIGPQRHSDHRFWASSGGYGFEDSSPGSEGPGPKLSETLRRALESDLERHLVRARERTSAQQWGSLPAGVRSEISDVQAQRDGKLDWRRILRLFASNGYRTKVVPTNKKLSKRFGTFPGIKIKREKRLSVVVDTSGSVNADLLALFFQEIHGIWKTGADIIVIECDAAVQQTYPYKGKPPESSKGGGGTAFDPAFAWLREPRNGRFDACIYLTDGLGPEPEIRPPCPLLWLVTEERGLGPHLRWGRSIRLEAEG